MYGKRPRTAAAWRRVVLVTELVACIALAATPARAVPWTRVLGTGDSAPGFIDGTRVGSFVELAPQLADDGTVAFTATAAGGSFFPLQIVALYRGSPGAAPERLALAAGYLFGGNAFASIDELHANAGGDVLFLGVRPETPSPCAAGEGPAQREFAVVYPRVGGHRIVAETFLPVPGLAAEWLDGLSCSLARFPRSLCELGPFPQLPPLLAADGGVALSANVAPDACGTAGVRSAFGPDGSGGEQLVARVGEPAPGTPIGVALGSIHSWSQRSLNASGQIGLRAALDDGNEAL